LDNSLGKGGIEMVADVDEIQEDGARITARSRGRTDQ
jgi:hypothetical protein